jgi:hypothetical protein
MVGAGRALFVADPTDDVEELAASQHLVDRKGRVIPYRRPASRRIATFAAAFLLFMYTGLTVGAEVGAAIGVGVAKPPKGVSGRIYVGVRLDHAQLGDATLLRQVRTLESSVVVDAQAVKGRSARLEALSAHGVDVANGGWGRRQSTFLRWNRAKTDVRRAGAIIKQTVGERAHEFVPGRRLDAFDQWYSRREKQRLVVPDVTLKVGDHVALPVSGNVYMIDGRGRSLGEMERVVARFQLRVERSGLSVSPLEELR